MKVQVKMVRSVTRLYASNYMACNLGPDEDYFVSQFCQALLSWARSQDKSFLDAFFDKLSGQIVPAMADKYNKVIADFSGFLSAPSEEVVSDA